MRKVELVCVVDKQSVFNLVAEHASHAERSERGLVCAYRGENSTKCFAGVVLSDDSYTQDMEGTVWYGNFTCGSRKVDLLIDKLQNVHDENEEDDWMPILMEVAEEEGLDTSVLETFLS